MSTKYGIHGVPTVLTKGAVDVLLSRCTGIREGAEPMSVRPVTEADCQRILEENQRFSENGLRVLAFGYKETTVEERFVHRQ